jgi:predicted PurR-regulated permease PerM
LEIVYFTAAAVALYFISDWILDRLERRRGARFAHRDLIFFAIILVLALLVFQLIRRLGG